MISPAERNPFDESCAVKRSSVSSADAVDRANMEPPRGAKAAAGVTVVSAVFNRVFRPLGSCLADISAIPRPVEVMAITPRNHSLSSDMMMGVCR